MVLSPRGDEKRANLLVPHLTEEARLWLLIVEALAAGLGHRVVGPLGGHQAFERGTGALRTREERFELVLVHDGERGSVVVRGVARGNGMGEVEGGHRRGETYSAPREGVGLVGVLVAVHVVDDGLGWRQVGRGWENRYKAEMRGVESEYGRGLGWRRYKEGTKKGLGDGGERRNK